MKKNMTYKEAVFVIFRMWHLVHKYRLRFYIGFLIGSTSIFFFRFLDSFLIQEFMEVCAGENQEMVMQSLFVVSAIVFFGIIVSCCRTGKSICTGICNCDDCCDYFI